MDEEDKKEGTEDGEERVCAFPAFLIGLQRRGENPPPYGAIPVIRNSNEH
jgi:hypothetical protein